MGELEDLEPHGKISIYHRGYGYIPPLLRKELKADREIPFFLDANVALLVRKGTSKEDVLRGLSALIKHLSVKWNIPEEKVKQLLGV